MDIKIKRVNRILIFILFFTLPLTGILGINPMISFTNICAAIVSIFTLNKMKVSKDDIIYYIFIVLMCFFTAINYKYSNMKSYFFILIYVLMYILFKKNVEVFYLENKKLILKIITVSLITMYIFILYEFITKNFIPSVFIDLPRNNIEIYNSTFSGKYFRARGFMEESGHASLFIEFTFPLVLYYIHKYKNSKWSIVFVVSTIIVQFFINSSLGIPLLILSYIVLLFLKREKNHTIKYFKIIFILFVSFIVFMYVYEKNIFNLQEVIKIIFLKLGINNSNNIFESSSYYRQFYLSESLDVISNNIISGIGVNNLNNFINYDTSFNMIVDIFAYGGIFTGITFISYLIYKFISIFRGNSDMKHYLMVSYLSVIIHYQIISNIWYPWIWILFGIISAEKKYVLRDRGTNEDSTYYNRT